MRHLFWAAAVTTALVAIPLSLSPTVSLAGSTVAQAGAASAWGMGSVGQLGNGSFSDSSVPVGVNLPAGTTVTAVAGGGAHSLALTSAGQVLAWGHNSYGQLGIGPSPINDNVPVTVGLPPGTVVTAIAAGGSHSLALTSTGQVLAWGYNAEGELGNGTTTSTGCFCIPNPIQVHLPQGTTATAISGGGFHSLALTSTGQILAWGRNDRGQLGNDSYAGSDVPTPVHLTPGTIATSIAAGESHSLGLDTLGRVLAWGDNQYGQLGDGTTTSSSHPVQVAVPSGASIATIASGADHSLLVNGKSEVLAWGYNDKGQLGDGTTINRSTPVTVGGITRPVRAISGGGAHSLAILQLPPAAVIPALSNGAYGGYITAVTVENTGIVPASVIVAYFDQNGAPVGAGDAVDNLPVHASWTVRQDNGHAFPGSGGDAAQAGSAIVYSSQPIASFVNEFAPGSLGDATSYTGIPVASGLEPILYAPTVVNNAYGGYTTGIGLLNQGSIPTDVTIKYRDAAGNLAKTQTVTGLAPRAYLALYSGAAGLGLPDGFAGTATIISSTTPVGAVVNETGPGGQFSSYDAVPAGDTKLNAPAALNNAYGGYNTGMAIQNTSAGAGTVTVTYHDGAGTATIRTFPIAAFGYLGIYQGSPGELPADGAYTATITSAVPLAAIVNEVAPATGAARQSTAYNTAGVGGTSLNLPLVENNGSDPWNTGLGIMNLESSTTTVYVTYHDAVTGAEVGTAQQHDVAPNAFWGVYQPTGGLPSGHRATAVISTYGGPRIAVICNESSPTTFMSYGAQ